ncbi:hypothetical protein ACHWQZ_G009646 [Mnemiopsis leidyi]
MPRSTGGFLERLDRGPVIGDGGFVFALEKRGYVQAGPWTPEAVIEHPEAVKQLHREFLRAGSDICQAFTFYASEDKLKNRGHGAGNHGVYAINKAAVEIVKECTYPEGGLVAGGLSQTPTYITTLNKDLVKAEVKKQLEVFKTEGVDLMICEYYEHVEEAEWHVEAVKEFMPGVPVCVSLCINETSDVHGVPTGECGVKLARAGADVVGINCHFDPFRCLAATKEMVAAVKKAGFDKVHFMIQPLGYMTPDASVQGFIDLPEFPFALEPRVCTRFEMMRYAREAYDAGIRFIGGCCGFEPYHIRALSEELSKERGGYMPVGAVNYGKFLEKHTKPWVRARASKEYWQTLKPGTGRPYSASLSRSDQWGVTAGHELVKQHEEETTKEELESGLAFKKQIMKEAI